MHVELRLPDLDMPGVAVIACCWQATVGQRITEGDRLLEVVAGDVAVDLPAPASGTLVKRCVEIDQSLETGQVLAVIEAE